MALYENRRILFEIITTKYKEYVELYKAVNKGSIKGVTSFEEFYWNYTYYSKYAGGRAGESRG